MVIKKCLNCNIDFETDNKRKKFCCEKCQIQDANNRRRNVKGTKDFYDITCIVCDKVFSSKRPHTKYCSKSCSHKDKTPKMFEKVCETCGEDFETTRKEGRYCSISCANIINKKIERESDFIVLNCLNCKRDFEVSFYIRSKRKYCSKSCAKSGEFHHYFGKCGKEHPCSGQSTWTKGKSAKTDSKIADLGKKISKTLKKKFENGDIKRDGKNNPMYGKKHSVETREKISKTRSEKWINGDYDSIFSKGVFFSKKMKKNMYYRSSWELIVLRHLDTNEEVIFYDMEPFSIEYTMSNEQNVRNYIPDLLIEYKNGIKKVIEIKPSFYIDYEINQSKFQSAKMFCENNGYIFEIWSEDKVRKIFQ